jgi:hypothetical protein
MTGVGEAALDGARLVFLLIGWDGDFARPGLLDDVRARASIVPATLPRPPSLPSCKSDRPNISSLGNLIAWQAVMTRVMLLARKIPSSEILTRGICAG